MFLDQDMFILNIRQAGAYYPFAGTPSLEPKHETYTHIAPATQPASHWSTESNFWA
jgi:hypothetical protein